MGLDADETNGAGEDADEVVDVGVEFEKDELANANAGLQRADEGLKGAGTEDASDEVAAAACVTRVVRAFDGVPEGSVA